jgi:hypothetical protein
MSNPYIGNTPTNVPLTTDQLGNGIVTTAKLASPIGPTIVGGTIDNAVIGATTKVAGSFTTVVATTGISGGTFT